MSLESVPSLETLTDPGRLAIKAWLDGEAVNRQSLLQLRKGIARWLLIAQPVRPLHAHGIARPHKVLRWRRVYLGVRPPIILEDVDKGEGVCVTRDIGLVAFRLCDFADATGEEREALIASLAREARLMALLQAAAGYHQVVKNRLEEQLGMQMEELALTLYTWLAIAHGPPQLRPPGFSEGFWEQIKTMRARLPGWHSEPEESFVQSIHYLFDDCFRLRKNVHDGPRIKSLIAECTPTAALDALMAIEAEQLDRDYRLKDEPLPDVLMTVQETVQHWRQSRQEVSELSPVTQAVLNRLAEDGCRGVPLSQVPLEAIQELEMTRPAVFHHLWILAKRAFGD
jgi:hypothetical protein